MENFLHKHINKIFLLVIVLDCIMQYAELPYTVYTEPLIVPLLLVKLFISDDNIGQPVPKFIFYIGLFFSLFGDVLQLVVSNTLFFYSSLVAFTIMNLCYTIAIAGLYPAGIKNPLRLVLPFLLLGSAALLFFHLLGTELGVFRMPLMVYVSSLVLVVLSALNLLRSPDQKINALRFFIPAVSAEVIQNLVFALNLFENDASARGFVPSYALYALSQFLMVSGILHTYVQKQDTAIHS